MPTIEWNKIIASVLTALIIMQVGRLLAEQIMRPAELERPVFAVAGTAPPPNAPVAPPAAASLAPTGPPKARCGG